MKRRNDFRRPLLATQTGENILLGPIGSLRLPFGSLLAAFGSIWLPLGSLWAPFGSLWLPFGSLWTLFWMFPSRVPLLYHFGPPLGGFGEHFGSILEGFDVFWGDLGEARWGQKPSAGNFADPLAIAPPALPPPLALPFFQGTARNWLCHLDIMIRTMSGLSGT